MKMGNGECKSRICPLFGVSVSVWVEAFAWLPFNTNNFFNVFFILFILVKVKSIDYKKILLGKVNKGHWSQYWQLWLRKKLWQLPLVTCDRWHLTPDAWDCYFGFANIFRWHKILLYIVCHLNKYRYNSVKMFEQL